MSHLQPDSQGPAARPGSDLTITPHLIGPPGSMSPLPGSLCSLCSHLEVTHLTPRVTQANKQQQKDSSRQRGASSHPGHKLQDGGRGRGAQEAQHASGKEVHVEDGRGAALVRPHPCAGVAGAEAGQEAADHAGECRHRASLHLEQSTEGETVRTGWEGEAGTMLSLIQGASQGLDNKTGEIQREDWHPSRAGFQGFVGSCFLKPKKMSARGS